MATVTLIYHDGDFLGAAKNYKAAINFLISQQYIMGEDEVAPFVCSDDRWYFNNGRLDEVVGPDWQHIMLNDWDIHEFNSFWDSWFELQEVNIYE